MDKSGIVTAILDKLRDEFDSRRAASKATRTSGNDAESKAENKYDTLSIEQNYLADGLAKQARIAAEAAAAYEKLPVRDFSPEETVDLGAVVEVAFVRDTEWFFLGPAAGGIEVSHEGRTITVLTPESPLGSQLLDRKAGDTIASPKCVLRGVF
jgi:transcription elongation GreA/GreB family factor